MQSVERGTVAHVMNERSEAAEAYLLIRGEYDKRGDKVAPATPKVFSVHGHRAAAQPAWVCPMALEPEHPLTARVTVNRFWQELFGTGLVRTAGDFGIAGEWPSHPELLDWLAVEFREIGWDVKKFYKLLVTSATYRQSAVVTKDTLGQGPAEPVARARSAFPHGCRDDPRPAPWLRVDCWWRRLGGPSVKPYQPDGVWEAVAMPESNTGSTTETRARTFTVAVSIRSGSAPRHRPRWTF